MRLKMGFYLTHFSFILTQIPGRTDLQMGQVPRDLESGLILTRVFVRVYGYTPFRAYPECSCPPFSNTETKWHAPSNDVTKTSFTEKNMSGLDLRYHTIHLSCAILGVRLTVYY